MARWPDACAQKKGEVIEAHLPYSFHDLLAKVTGDFGGIRRLSVSAHLDSESVNEVDTRDHASTKMALEWGNAAVSVHYRDRFGANGIIDVTLGHSRFRSDALRLVQESVAVDDEGVEYEPSPDTLLFGNGTMSESRADVRVTWHAGRAAITAGTQALRFEGNHDYSHTDLQIGGFDVSPVLSPLTVRETHWRLAAYTSVEVPIGHGFATRAGLRVDRFQGLATEFSSFAELGYAASWWNARVSAARSHQALASLRNEEALLASYLAYDLVVPVSASPVPCNTGFLIGWEGLRSGFRVRLDAYTRKLDNLRLPDLKVNPIRASALGDPALWRVASGTARGIEASWSWMPDRGISVLGSYRWAAVSRKVGSRTYVPRFHRDHEFELGSSFRHGASSWSARISLRSGQPATPWLALVPAAGSYHPDEVFKPVLLGGEYNSVKLPHYARIDVGWRHEAEVSWFGGGSVVPYASVANLFSLPNVVGWLPQPEHYSGEISRVFERQLPMIPFIGLEFRFWGRWWPPWR